MKTTWITVAASEAAARVFHDSKGTSVKQYLASCSARNRASGVPKKPATSGLPLNSLISNS